MFDVPSNFTVPQVTWPSVKKFIPFVGMAVGVLGVAATLSALFINPIVAPVQAESPDVCITQPFAGELTVYISGAVASPGVYKLPSGTRLGEVVAQAGGPSPQVDAVYLQKTLNLAQELADSEHIYIPFAAETQSTTANSATNNDSTNTSVSSTQTSESDSSLISINTASQSQLESLPRIGEKTAEKIIAGRPYSGLSELVTKQVLSQTVYDEIKAQLTN